MIDWITLGLVAGAFVYVSQIHSQLKKVIREIQAVRAALGSGSKQSL